MRLQTNSIVDKNGGGNVEFQVPPDINNTTIIINGNLEFGGICTISEFVSANNVTTSEIITASSFVGDGSGLNIPTIEKSKSIALKYIFADPPLRS
jgi:hypothetical protein